MPTKLFASMGFALCSLVFYIVVLVLYINKRKTKKIENKSFTFMLIFTFILLMNELLYIYAMYAELDAKINFLKTKPLCHAYIVLSVFWFAYLLIYIWTIVKKYDSNKEKHDKPIFLIISLVVIIMSVISFALGIEYPTSKSNLYVFSGPAVYTIYIIGVLVLIAVVIALIKGGNKIPAYQKNPMYFCILTLIVMITIQLVYDFDCNLLSFLYTIVLTTLYFTIESQDYKLMDDLEKKKQEAEIADRAQTEFLTNMSHEIRTPLNTILGFSESLLSEKNLSKEIIDRDVSMINDASNSLLDLINNILDISRLESGKETLEEKEYLIETLLNEIDSVITPKYNNKELKFLIDADKNIPKSFYGDYLKIYKLIMAIINNAFKYTNFGNVTLSISGKKNENDMFDFMIIISNTGHEMSEKNFNIDFNDFVKIGSEEQNIIDNKALGLIISKKYVEMLGGNITFENKPGHGTKYIIELSQKIVNNEEIGEYQRYKENEIDSKNKLDCSGNRVLVVDDNLLNIKLTSRLLEQYNFTVDWTTSGKEGIEKIKSCKYNLIFLDHMMPEMDGIETFKIISKIGNFDVPVIALTANNSPGLKEMYQNYGFYDFLSKPINKKELDIMINNMFGNK